MTKLLSDIVAELKAESSTNAKRDILFANKDNHGLRDLFYLTYSPRVKFWIKAPKSVDKSGPLVLSPSILYGVSDTLNGRLLTGNAARDYLLDILESMIPAEQKILIQMINRDMDCKVSLGLINKTWKNLVPEFPVMLAEKFNPKTSKPFYAAEVDYFASNDGKRIVVQKKSDGGRMSLICSNNNISLGYSRNGSELKLNGVFDCWAKDFGGFVLDGEIVFKDMFGCFLDRKDSNGLFNKMVRNTISDEELKYIHFVVWDLIPEEDFWAGKSNLTYRQRLKKLTEIVSTSMHNISLVQTALVSTVDQAFVFYSEMLEQGEEGAMIKLLDSPWEADRVKHVLKLKEELDAALLCTGVLPHKKNPAWIGSLECVSSCGKLEVSIGSGLTEADREKDPSYFIGQIIDLKFNDILKSDNKDTWSLFLPIYKGIRTDKTIADTLAHLQQ